MSLKQSRSSRACNTAHCVCRIRCCPGTTRVRRRLCTARDDCTNGYSERPAYFDAKDLVNKFQQRAVFDACSRILGHRNEEYCTSTEALNPGFAQEFPRHGRKLCDERREIHKLKMQASCIETRLIPIMAKPTSHIGITGFLAHILTLGKIPVCPTLLVFPSVVPSVSGRFSLNGHLVF